MQLLVEARQDRPIRPFSFMAIDAQIAEVLCRRDVGAKRQPERRVCVLEPSQHFGQGIAEDLGVPVGSAEEAVASPGDVWVGRDEHVLGARDWDLRERACPTRGTSGWNAGG